MFVSRALSILLHIEHYRAWAADGVRTWRRHRRAGDVYRSAIWADEAQYRLAMLKAWKGGAL